MLHDFTCNRWGHALHHCGQRTEPGKRYTWAAHSLHDIKKGDTLATRGNASPILLYTVHKVEHCLDPNDMFFVTVELTGTAQALRDDM